MIVVVAPEPVTWLDAVVAAARQAGAVTVLAPWAIGDAAARVAGLLPIARAFVARRRAPAGADTAALWPVGQAILRAWSGGRVDRRYAAMFAERAAVDRWAARRLRAGVTAVIAPSCAALATFAAARARGAVTILVEDLPDLRALHRDLDRAAAARPAAAFLRRYRAPVAAVQRQERERVAATTLLVRGAWARARRVAAGVAPTDVLALPGPHLAGGIEARPGSGRVLLAGLAAARAGVHLALAALAARPHLTLVVRAGEGAEPGVLDHPRVVAATAADLALDGIDAVIAPSWCEAYPREVALAAHRGVPVIATAAAAGFVELGAIPSGDAVALGAALDRALAAPAPAPVLDDGLAHHALVARLAGPRRSADDRLTRMKILLPLALATLIVACSAPAKPAGVPENTSSNDAGTTQVQAPDPGARCLPVVARACGCVYACGAGAPRGDGGYDVTHAFWKGATLRATIARYCEAGPCVDVFDATIICDGICAPSAPDASCHFAADGSCSGS